MGCPRLVEILCMHSNDKVEPALPRVVPNLFLLVLHLLTLIQRTQNDFRTTRANEMKTNMKEHIVEEGTHWGRRRSMTMKNLACRVYCLSPSETTRLLNLAIRPNGDCWRFLMRGSVLYITRVTGKQNILGAQCWINIVLMPFARCMGGGAH